MLIASVVILLVLLTFLFNHILDRQHNPNQVLEGRTLGGMNEITLQRNRNGHYVANGAINGIPVVFLLDTGATDVAVPSALARKLGLRSGMPINLQTANGSVTGYSTYLENVTLGNIQQQNVRAIINPGMNSQDEVLLGMSFLKHLELIQRGEQLTIRQLPYKS